MDRRAQRRHQRVLHSSTALTTAVINQEQNPGDFIENGTAWEDLGDGLFTITTGTLVVRLSVLTDEFVIADAVRIQRLA